MKKYPDCNGNLVPMKNSERRDIILKKLEKIDELVSDIMAMIPETLGKKDKEEIVGFGRESCYDLDSLLYELEYE